MDYKDSIEKTKKGFEASFGEGKFYNKQTRDDNHINKIMDFIKIKDKIRILDLGTGSGYLAFSLAKRYEEVEIVGLDIVEKTLIENTKKASEENISNVKFISYDGIRFPFEDNSFDIVVTRYALHHFPKINDTFKEINRVLKNDGQFFVSDSAPNDDDGFVDAYMQMKKDGHIKFYSKDEWIEIAKNAGLNYSDDFETSIRFPKKKETAIELDDILKKHDDSVIRGYNLEIINDEIWITERVNNILFSK